MVLAAPSGACPVLVPVRFLCASRPCSFVHWLEQGMEARTGSWGCRCRSGNDLKGLPWEEGCGKGFMPGKSPRFMSLGAGLAQVNCRCLCPWPDEGRLPLILLGMLATSLWPLCLGTASSTCELWSSSCAPEMGSQREHFPPSAMPSAWAGSFGSHCEDFAPWTLPIWPLSLVCLFSLRERGS